jgi:hypothetical protein
LGTTLTRAGRRSFGLRFRCAVAGMNVETISATRIKTLANRLTVFVFISNLRSFNLRNFNRRIFDLNGFRTFDFN